MLQLKNLVRRDVVNCKCFTQTLAELLSIVLGHHDKISESLTGPNYLFALDDGFLVQLPHLHDFSFLGFNCFLVEKVLLVQLVKLLLLALFFVDCFFKLFFEGVNLFSDKIKLIVEFL